MSETSEKKNYTYPAIWTEHKLKELEKAGGHRDFEDSSIMNKKLSPNSD